MKFRAVFIGCAGLAVVAFSGCGSSEGPGVVLGVSRPVNPPVVVPPATGNDGGGGGDTGTATKPALGASCHSADPSRYCLALNYVVFKDSSGKPAISAAQTMENVRTINALWDKCGIAFQIDSYLEVSPTDFGLRASPATMGDLTEIRREFDDDRTLLVATTVGDWSISANAWTTMPGGDPAGAVIEGSVGTYAPIIAHELGHYLNLDHVSDASYLMNAVIYSNSSQIGAGECSQARAAISYFWSAMIR